MFHSVHLLTDECVLIYWGKLYNIKHTYQINFIALIFLRSSLIRTIISVNFTEL